VNVADQIKDKLPLAEYVGRRVALKRDGHNLKGVCPHHNERNASLVVYPDQDTWWCFGCGKGGDIFNWYQLEHHCEFKDALRELAREAGVELRAKPEEVEHQAKLRQRSAILGAALEYYRKQLNDEHREYLRSRGFKDEFISSYRFGYAPGGGLKQHLNGSVSAVDLQAIGLVNHDGRDFFWNRIIIPIYGRDGEVVNLVGRLIGSDEGPKYLRLPGEGQLVNERALRSETVYLCEGDTDTPTLIQAGLPAVGVPGASALKDEYLDKFQRCQTIYVCADADESGLKLTMRAGELLGNRCYIVELPEGEDVNSWVGVKGNDITTLTATAKPFIDYLIAHLPSEIGANTIDRTLEPVLIAVSKVGKASQDIYIKQIAKAVGMSAGAVKEALRERVSAQEEQEKKSTPHGDGRIIWRDVREINPAQDWVNGTMYTVAFLDVQVIDPETEIVKLETQPYVVTSKRELFALSDGEAYQRGLRITSTKIPAVGIVGRRWTTSDEYPYSVKNYVDGGITVSPWEVYTEVVGYFRKFIDYPNDLYYDFVALWTIGTYFYNLYQAYPYVHLTGTKRVGKSLTLKVVAELAFNALFSSSMSSAAAYRAVESCSTTLLLDEAENLQKKDKGNEHGDDKIEILKAGYMKGPKAIRCTGDNHEPTAYDVYSPKMFGSIQAMDKILADRAITLTLARKKRELPPFDFVEVKKDMAATRDKLHVLQLEHAKDVIEEIKAGIGWDGVKDREKELWTPILTLAQFFDAYQVGEGEKVDPSQLLTVRMRKLAEEKGAEKLAKEQAEQTELLILEGLLDYLKTATPIKDNYYGSTAILNHLQGIEELSWMKDARQVTRELERVTIIQNKNRDMTRVQTESGKRIRAIKLDPVRIREIAQRYGAAI
jgi:DNA primase